MLGAQSSPCLEEGEFQLVANYRHFTADEQYSDGSDLNPVVMNTNTQVISEMHYMEIGGIYAVNQQLNLTLGIPYLLEGSSSRTAFPETVKVYEKYKGQGLRMVWINIVEEEEDKIQDWLAAHQYTVPVLVGASQQYLMRRYKVQMTPEHFLLNAESDVDTKPAMQRNWRKT